jgi:hypothetical protein
VRQIKLPQDTRVAAAIDRLQPGDPHHARGVSRAGDASCQAPRLVTGGRRDPTRLQKRREIRVPRGAVAFTLHDADDMREAFTSIDHEALATVAGGADIIAIGEAMQKGSTIAGLGAVPGAVLGGGLGMSIGGPVGALTAGGAEYLRQRSAATSRR